EKRKKNDSKVVRGSEMKRNELVETSPTDAAVRNRHRKQCRPHGKRTSDKTFDGETIGTADTATTTAAEYAAVATVENRIDDELNELNELNPASVKNDVKTAEPTILRTDSARARELANDEAQRTEHSLCGCIEKETIQRQHRPTNDADLAKPLPTEKPTKHRQELGILPANDNDSVLPTPPNPKLSTLTSCEPRIESDESGTKRGNLENTPRSEKLTEKLETSGKRVGDGVRVWSKRYWEELNGIGRL
ncbi:hypothetical protein HK104_005643, partial [Borealophlyctis nickersoniae]